MSWGRWLRSAAGCAAMLALGAGAPALAQEAPPSTLKFTPAQASAEGSRLREWVLRTGDHRGRPFAVVDKRGARIYVFDAAGALAGESAALLGQTVGDHTVPGVGERAQRNAVGLDERTTPAGRFEAHPGRNLQGEHVVWADYASAFAIHRLRPDAAWKARSVRLASETPDDNRASLGCVVVPVAFYEEVVQRVLGQGRSVVYVLPDSQPLQDLFTAFAQP